MGLIKPHALGMHNHISSVFVLICSSILGSECPLTHKHHCQVNLPCTTLWQNLSQVRQLLRFVFVRSDDLRGYFSLQTQWEPPKHHHVCSCAQHSPEVGATHTISQLCLFVFIALFCFVFALLSHLYYFYLIIQSLCLVAPFFFNW